MDSQTREAATKLRENHACVSQLPLLRLHHDRMLLKLADDANIAAGDRITDYEDDDRDQEQDEAMEQHLMEEMLYGEEENENDNQDEKNDDRD